MGSLVNAQAQEEGKCHLVWCLSRLAVELEDGVESIACLVGWSLISCSDPGPVAG